ncbi:MAG TPA: hypothetical protein VLF09_14395 [Cellvibrio sp.]|nr:hypothetical protein [Cellvibrio sp.]
MHLRTSLDQLSVWKTKYVKTNMSPFDAKLKTTIKEAAIIDKEVWVFGIDSTKAQDIVAAIEIATRWYKVGADKILSDVYVKNLNAELCVGASKPICIWRSCRRDKMEKSAVINEFICYPKTKSPVTCVTGLCLFGAQKRT